MTKYNKKCYNKFGDNMLLRREKKEKKELDINNVNETVSILKTILKIVTVLLFIIGFYIVTKLLKEWHVKENVLTILKILLPLFIGFFLAWLFDPFVSILQKKGVRRTFGAAITYIIFIGIIALILGSLIPLLGSQINDFVKIVPEVLENIKVWAEEVFDKLGDSNNVDIESIKENIFSRIEVVGSDLTSSLPELTINLLKSIFSGIGNFVVGLIIGFFLLINFNNVSDSIITLFPKKMQNDTRDIFNEINPLGTILKYLLPL